VLPQHNPTTGARRSLNRGSEYVIAALVVLALWGLTVVSFSKPASPAFSHTVIFNIAVTTASLLVSLGAAYFVLIEFTLYGRLTSLFVATAFLLFGMANGGMGLVPELWGWDGQAQLVPYGWAAQRVVGAALLLAAPLLVDREIPVVRRRQLVGASVLLTLLVSAGVATWVWHAGTSTLPSGVQTAIQLLACVTLFGAAALFWRAPRGEISPWFFGLALALTVAGFAELQYAIHPYVPGVAQLGDLLRLVFYSGILLILGAEGSRGYRKLRWQARELSALQALMTPASVQDLPRVIQHIVDVAGRTFRANAQVILSGREDRQEGEDAPHDLLGVAQRTGLATQEVQTVLLSDGDDARARSVAALPLRVEGREIGTLVVDRQGRSGFSVQDVRLLRAFGVQASVLLERSLLYEEVAAGAIIEERSRLAREIHDGLAQHLAFLKMRVSWLKRSPAALDVGQLIDLETVLETALTEARTAITTLRAEPEGTSTAEAISSYANEFGQVSGLAVEVDAEGEVPEVGPKVRVELMRVVQEALNNVRKHANAKNVIIHITGHDGGMEVSIHDDGTGFSLKEELQGHFGMDIMNERTQSIGGQLDVVSAPRRGTNVRVWVPAQETSAPQAFSRLA
jgi:signal transduction histidine kinase